MKRSSLLVLCVLALVLTQCAPAATPTPVIKEVVKQQTVVVKETVIAPTAVPECPKEKYALTAPLIHPYVTQWAVGGEGAAKELGFELVYLTAADYSTTRHQELTEAAIGMPCMKGIGVMTGESATLRATMEEAVARGIYVTQSGDCPKDVSWVCMSTDVYNSAQAVAKEIAKRLNNTGNVLVAMGVPDNVHQSREDGLKDWFAANAPGMKVVGTLVNCDDAEGTVKCAEEAISKYPQMDAYYSTGLMCAVGAYSVFSEAGRDDILVTAVDDTPEVLAAIRGGKNTFTYTQQPYGQGYLQVYIPWLMVHKGVKPTGLKNNFLDTRITIVDKSNVESYTDTMKQNFLELKKYVETEVMK